MAKTQQQWFETLKSWVPSWVFDNSASDINVAVFMAIAKVLEAAEADMEAAKTQTFIDEAVAPYLDVHGSERSVPRLTGELDPQYRIRIKNASLVSQVNRPALLAIINQFLHRGVAQIREDYEGAVFVDREHFVNRGEIVLEQIYNAFSIVLDNQLHDPYSFVDREYFADREDFVGDTISSDYIFNLILNAVNDNKAFGVLYRIFERTQ